MVQLLFFLFVSFLLFLLINVDYLRNKILPKSYLELEDRFSGILLKLLGKNGFFLFFLTLGLAFLLILSFFLEKKFRIWYSIWVVVFGFFYLIFKKLKNEKIKEKISKFYYFSLKSTFIPSYVIYRLSIINIAVFITGHLVSFLDSRGILLSTILIGGVGHVPLSAPTGIQYIGEMFLKFLKVIPEAEKIGYSRILTEITRIENNNNKTREEGVFHLAKYLVKENRFLLKDGKYSFLSEAAKSKLIVFEKSANIQKVAAFANNPVFDNLKKTIMYSREEVGGRDFEVSLKLMAGDSYRTTESLKDAHNNINKYLYSLIEEIGKGKTQTRKDLIQSAALLSIMENLPREALAVGKDGLEDLNILKDSSASLNFTNENRPLLDLNRMKIQITESLLLNYVLEYLRSLGEIEKIERSTDWDYKIIYKDGREVHVECKFSEGVDLDLTKEKLPYLAWYNTKTKYFTLSKVLANGVYEEIGKIENVPEARKVGNLRLKMLKVSK